MLPMSIFANRGGLFENFSLCEENADPEDRKPVSNATASPKGGESRLRLYLKIIFIDFLFIF